VSVGVWLKMGVKCGVCRMWYSIPLGMTDCGSCGLTPLIQVTTNLMRPAIKIKFGMLKAKITKNGHCNVQLWHIVLYTMYDVLLEPTPTSGGMGKRGRKENEDGMMYTIVT